MLCYAIGAYERAYHQLGNTACPVIVAAVAANLLAAVGRPTRPPATLVGELDAHRTHAAAALELLCAASPLPDAERAGGRPPLRELCAAFLRRAAGAPPGCAGCGEALAAAELPVVRTLLQSLDAPLAQLAGLRTVHHLAHQLSYAHDAGDVARAATVDALRHQLLPLVAICLANACCEESKVPPPAAVAAQHAEVMRLAVVTLAVASRCHELAGALVRDSASEQVVRALAMAGDAKLASQAGEALRGVFLLPHPPVAPLASGR
jgi:hypothetical protein